MAPEADSGPGTDDVEPPCLPSAEGWLDLGDGFLRPDPESVLYPTPQQRHEKGTRKRLDADPRIQEEVHTLEERFRPINARILEARLASNESGTWDSRDFDRLWDEEMPKARALLRETAQRCAATKVAPGHACLNYLIEKTLDAEVADHLADRLEPVLLRANASPDDRYVVVRPGEFFMRFTNASTRERGEAIRRLITNLQAAWGYPKNEGGQPDKRDNPGKAEQAKAAAKLHHWAGWSYDDIATFFGWTGSQDTVRELVRRRVRAGEKLLGDKKGGIGPGWEVRPPERLAAKT